MRFPLSRWRTQPRGLSKWRPTKFNNPSNSWPVLRSPPRRRPRKRQRETHPTATSRTESPAHKTGEPDATAARQAVQASEEAIAAQADQLGQILDAAEQAAHAGEASAPAAADSGKWAG